jgi:hypothetical protein
VDRIVAFVRPLGRALLIALLAGPSLSGAPSRSPAAAAQYAALTSITATVGPVTPDPRNTPVESVTIQFSAPINPESFSVADLALTRSTVGGSIELPLATVASIRQLDATTYAVENLRVLTTPNGDYALSVLLAQIEDPSGAPLSGTAIDTWHMDALGPIVVAVGPIIPARRTTPVQTVDVTFSEAILPATFTRANLALTRDGVPLDMSGIGITQVSALTYRLSGLTELTRPLGTYTLTVNPSGILDPLGNTSGPEFARTETWHMTNAPTIVALASPTPRLRNTPVESLDVTLSEPVDLNTFTAQDLALTRDGQALDLAGVTVSQAGASTYRIGALGALTAQGGQYELTVDLSGVSDLDDGNSGVGSASAVWTTDVTRPTAAASALDISLAGGATQLINVVYTDSQGLDILSVGTGDLLVSGPNGFTQAPPLVGVVAGQAGSWLATYRVAAPGGAWDATDNGSYSVVMQEGQVRDLAGNSAAAGALTSFRVAVPEMTLRPRQYLTTIWTPVRR